jgi:hypothetical protein
MTMSGTGHTGSLFRGGWGRGTNLTINSDGSIIATPIITLALSIALHVSECGLAIARSSLLQLSLLNFVTSAIIAYSPYISLHTALQHLRACIQDSRQCYKCLQGLTALLCTLSLSW